MGDAWGAVRDRTPFAVRQVARHLRARIPHAVRYGAAYRNTRRFLADSEWWSRSRLEEYQRERLRQLIRFVHGSIPFYRDRLDACGLSPGQFGGLEDLRRLPLLTKDVLRENVERLVPADISRSRLLRVTTGGTTGMPMSVYWLRGITESREWAFIWRGWGWAGFHPRMRRVILRGDLPRPRRGRSRPHWEYNPIDQRLIMSTFDMNRETIGGYVDRIEEFRPQAIQAYPSALLPLTSYLIEQRRKIRDVKCVLTCSESVFPGQRAMVKEALECDIHDHYGTTERSVLVMQCEKLRYHVIPEYGILELIGTDGEPIEEAGVAGEIVVTGFINPTMPLLRYRTGDIAIRRAGSCECGRNHDLLERVAGRIQEFFVDGDGSLASAIWSDGPLWELPDRVEAYQYVQDRPGELVLSVEAEAGLSSESRERIRQRFRKHYPRFALQIRRVERIARTGRGKFRYVLQNLDLNGREIGQDV